MASTRSRNRRVKKSSLWVKNNPRGMYTHGKYAGKLGTPHTKGYGARIYGGNKASQEHLVRSTRAYHAAKATRSHQVMRGAKKSARQAGYRIARKQNNPYQVKFKATLRTKHRTRRNYRGQFAGSY